MMSSYEMEYVWLPQEVNEGHNDFIEWLLIFIKETVDCLQTKSVSTHEEIAYASIGYISKIYWDYLSECK